jgi:hypothetical protein
VSTSTSSPTPKRRRGAIRTGATKDAPTDLEIEQRRQQVAYLLGQRATRAEIARSLSVSRQTIDRDVDALRAYWREQATGEIAEIVGTELATLDALERRLWSERLRTQPIDPRDIETLLKILDRRARILGLDKPRKVEVTGPGGTPLVPTDDERLLEEIERLGERLATLPVRDGIDAPG